ncbi:MAG: hypothetical protein KBF75_04510 [Saprospiraceae bacterium]|jgi:hypothetical protein|nr:hypothetical protein [Saprospiraceae bacterium]MCA0332434.1 hypothetical protein [Bacteroidota bacterium]MCB0604086.1 hypothetical protein [Saprospiraceae bacterium]MCO5276922.1 hypothetical protein [Saprospiraceae bacterium]HMT76565.1 hypothetical protein [Saprospiraceae bacterium]
MPRSNRKAHSKSSTFRKNVTYTQGGNQEVKLTKEQLAEDAKDQKKFFMILIGITLAILIIVYLLYFRKF